MPTVVQDEPPAEKTVNANYPTPHPVTEIPVDDLPFISIPACMHDQRGRSRSEGSAERSATDSLPAPSPHSNVHTPASLDNSSEHSQNLPTPSSQDAAPHSRTSYSPPPNYFSEFSGMPMTVDGMDGYGMSKDMMNWELPSEFDGSVNLEHMTAGMAGLNGMGVANPELSDLFVERTT